MNLFDLLFKIIVLELENSGYISYIKIIVNNKNSFN